MNTKIKSPALEKSGDKTPQQNPPVSANQSEVLGQELSFTCFVPSNFNINEYIENYPPEFKFHKDKFHYLIHLITDIPLKRKRTEDGTNFWEKEDYFFTCLYSPLIQSKVRDYTKYLKHLVDNGVLICDNQYIKGKKSMGYKFSRQYQTEIKPVLLSKQIFIRRILKFVNLDYPSFGLKSKTSNYNNEFPKYDYLTKWFDKKLTINYTNARKHIDLLYNRDKKQHGHEGAIRKKNHRRIVIEKIHRSCFINTVDNTAGRLHTVLSQLKSELRQFLKYDGKKLIALDLKNSQPFLSAILLDYNKIYEDGILQMIRNINENINTPNNPYPKPYYVSKNIENYKALVASGNLYEKFIHFLSIEGVLDSTEDFEVLRQKAKKGIISAIFSPNNSIAYNKFIQVFENYFPDVYEIFKCIKFGKGRHNTLAITLQTIEAQLILGKACSIITKNNPQIPLFTLHDAIITTEEHASIVESVMKKVLTESIGLVPQIKREPWSA